MLIIFAMIFRILFVIIIWVERMLMGEGAEFDIYAAKFSGCPIRKALGPSEQISTEQIANLC